MAWSISDLFPPWGDAGERPSDNFQYDGGQQVNEKHLDYLWAQINALENETRDALTDLDADKDGIVDAADEGAAPFTTRGDVQTNDTTPLTIWDDTNQWVPQARLENDSVTVAGNAVSLGGSTAVALGDLSNVTATGEGSGGGFDADTVDGNHASDIDTDPDWTEDANSPFILTPNTETATLNFNSSYDAVKIWIERIEADSNLANLTFHRGNSATAEHDTKYDDGTTNTNANRWDLLTDASLSQYPPAGWIKCWLGKGGGGIGAPMWEASLNQESMGNAGSYGVQGNYQGHVGQWSDITFEALSYNITVLNARVFGVNF